MLANLKALRTAQGLSQRALADFVKVSQQSINQYENRDTEPDIAVLTRIADYFGVSIDYLVGHDPAAGELIPTNLTDAELRLILNFRQLDDDQQRSMNLLVMQMTKDNKRNAKPSICGMMRSSTITSTRTLPSASSASAPDGHSATTFMPSCRAR